MKLFVKGAWVDTIDHVFTGGSWKPCLTWLFVNGAWVQVSGLDDQGTIKGDEFNIENDMLDGFNFARDVGGIPIAKTYTINIKPGITVKAPDASTPAFSFGGLDMEGWTIIINNEGTIAGKGGHRGEGGTFEDRPGKDGGDGGTAMLIDTLATVTVNNKATGIIAAGGGGGGGSGAYKLEESTKALGRIGATGTDGDDPKTYKGQAYYSDRRGRGSTYAVSDKAGDSGPRAADGGHGGQGYHLSYGTRYNIVEGGRGGTGGLVFDGKNRITLNSEVGSIVDGRERDIPLDGYVVKIDNDVKDYNLFSSIGIPEENKIYVLIDKDVRMESSNPTIPAFTIGNTYAGKTIIIKNRGLIMGKGGIGGVGSDGTNGASEDLIPATDGGKGGDAIVGATENPVEIWNYGTIGSGGGGAGGAGGYWQNDSRSRIRYSTAKQAPNGRDGDNPDMGSKVYQGHDERSSYAPDTWTGEPGGAGLDGTAGSSGRNGKHYKARWEGTPKVSEGGQGGAKGIALNLQVDIKELGTLYGPIVKQDVVADATISVDTGAYDLYTVLGDTPKDTINVVINVDVTVKSTDATVPAFSVGSQYAGKTIIIHNYGTIAGKGGNGGTGGTETVAGGLGQDGGDAIKSDPSVNLIVKNYGTIGAGGGGGGGSAYAHVYSSNRRYSRNGVTGQVGKDGDDPTPQPQPTRSRQSFGYRGRSDIYSGYQGKGGERAQAGSKGGLGSANRATDRFFTYLPGHGGLPGYAIRGNIVVNDFSGYIYGSTGTEQKPDVRLAYDAYSMNLKDYVTDMTKTEYTIVIPSDAIITQEKGEDEAALLIGPEFNGKTINLINKGKLVGQGGSGGTRGEGHIDGSNLNGGDGQRGGTALKNTSDTPIKLTNEGTMGAGGGGAGGGGGAFYVNTVDTDDQATAAWGVQGYTGNRGDDTKQRSGSTPPPLAPRSKSGDGSVGGGCGAPGLPGAPGGSGQDGSTFPEAASVVRVEWKGTGGQGGPGGTIFEGDVEIVANTGTFTTPVPVKSTYQWTIGGRYGEFGSIGGGPYDGYSKLVPSEGFGSDPDQAIEWSINADGKLHVTTGGTQVGDNLKVTVIDGSATDTVTAAWTGTQYDAPSDSGFYNFIKGRKKKTITVTVETV